MVGCPFRTLAVLYWMFALLCSLKWLMFGIIFLYLSTSLRCFCPWTIFLNNGLDNIHGPPLYQIYILIVTLSGQLCHVITVPTSLPRTSLRIWKNDKDNNNTNRKKYLFHLISWFIIIYSHWHLFQHNTESSESVSRLYIGCCINVGPYTTGL